MFEAGASASVFEWKGVKLGAPICEDIWSAAICADLKAQGAEILLVPNGSPFRRTADHERMGVAKARVAETGLPMLYVNEVGGQDELVFDGGSFALSAQGEVVMRLPMFEEAFALTVWEKGQGGWACVEAPMADWVSGPEEVYRAMVLGLRDYVNKSGFPGVLWACPAASTRRSAPWWRPMRSAPTASAASCCPRATPARTASMTLRTAPNACPFASTRSRSSRPSTPSPRC